MGKATLDLRNEHEAILFALSIMEEMTKEALPISKLSLQYRYELIDFLKIFADKCHHGKEENILFKAMEEQGIQNEGGPIGVMLSEHVQGRGHIAGMKAALDEGNLNGFNASALEYINLLRVHINKENMILFKFADQVLDEDKQEELYAAFSEHEEEIVGHGVHERLHAQIDTWANAYDIKQPELI